MKYKTYDELISLVDEFRLEHNNLTDDELDKLVKKTFRIDQSILRELDGWVDYYDDLIGFRGAQRWNRTTDTRIFSP